MSGAYTREGKTDPKDAYVIADTARIRRSLPLSTTRQPGLQPGPADRPPGRPDRRLVRMINRLRDVLTSVFPALEWEFDYSSCKGALVLLTGYACPARLRASGRPAWPAGYGSRGCEDSVGVSSPARMFIKVDLPDPDAPTMAVSSPGEITRSRPCMACTSMPSAL